MKHTTKLLLLLFAISFHQLINAQQTRFAITAGASISNWAEKVSGIKVTTKTIAGFTGGFNAFLPVSTNLNIMTGLNVVQKGTGADDPGSGQSETIKLTYIEVPLNIVYTSNGFFGGVGPTIAFGISGKDKLTDQNGTTTNTLKFGNTIDDDIKPIDIGANIVAGYIFTNKVMITANYNFGLSNLQPSATADDGKLVNNYFGIKLGYIFK
ncbi:MAG TPA: outer membrane beta-barrel protein [Flavisolibacter sp.]|jgi:hypothetical protein|nr:outer membrane beta-barrel protein [Flavisolibacter sp.]